MTEPRLSDNIDETSDHAVDDDSDVVRPGRRGVRRSLPARRVALDRRVRAPISRALPSRIRELLPSVAMMERLKRQVRASAEGVAEPPEPAPERLGEYRIVRELGRGGMGIVYEAFQESLGRHVALKVIPRHGLLEGKRRRRFQREAQAVAQLHHTNIVPIFAVGEHDGLPYLRDAVHPRQRARPAAGRSGGATAWRGARTTGGSWPGSASRRPRPSSTPTTRGSSTATSSRPTC